MTSTALKPPELLSTAGKTELRSVSVLLAVLSKSPVFAREFLRRAGAPSDLLSGLGVRNSGVTLETGTEHYYAPVDGESNRIDGLIRLSRGQRKWTLLIEAKVNGGALGETQVTKYWSAARKAGVKTLVLISNDMHVSDRPRNYPRVKQSVCPIVHFSWTEILAMARLAADQTKASSIEEWLLGEFSRYLDNPRSGVVRLDNMGTGWNQAVKNAAKNSLGIDHARDIAVRLGQVFLHTSFRLSAHTATNIRYLLPSDDETLELAASLADGKPFVGEFTRRGSSPVNVAVDITNRRVMCSTSVWPPEPSSTNTPKVDWLRAQVRDAPNSLMVEAWAKTRRTGVLRSASVRDLVQAKSALVPARGAPAIAYFKIIDSKMMSTAKESKGRASGFVRAFERQLRSFYDLTLVRPQMARRTS